MNKKEIRERLQKIEDFDLDEVVKTALEAWENAGKKKSGYAVLNPYTLELEGVSLGVGEEIPGDERIYLYEVPQNILGNNGYEAYDWLSPEEIDDMEKRNDEGEDLYPELYIEKYTDDTVEERLEKILIFYLEEDELDWDSIESQLNCKKLRSSSTLNC